MKVADYIKKLAAVDASERVDLVEAINIQNYAMNMLSETDMWILRTAAENADYLNDKLEEADELSLDIEAPAETEEEVTDAATEGGDELSLDMGETTPTEGGDDLPMDTPTEDDSLDMGGEEAPEISIEPEISTELPEVEPTVETEPETTEETPTEEPKEEKPEKEEIETSLEGIGILPLLAEIQEKLANGKPSEVELAALKAMKKLF